MYNLRNHSYAPFIETHFQHVNVFGDGRVELELVLGAAQTLIVCVIIMFIMFIIIISMIIIIVINNNMSYVLYIYIYTHIHTYIHVYIHTSYDMIITTRQPLNSMVAIEIPKEPHDL